MLKKANHCAFVLNNKKKYTKIPDIKIDDIFLIPKPEYEKISGVQVSVFGKNELRCVIKI